MHPKTVALEYIDNSTHQEVSLFRLMRFRQMRSGQMRLRRTHESRSNGGLRLASTVVLLLLGSLWNTAMSHENNLGIHVTGSGEVSVEPDMARFNLQVTRQGRDPAALKREMDAVTASVLKLTDKLKIQRKDVTAAMVQIQPNRVYQNNRQTIDGVIATRGISIVLRELDNIGDLINGALDLGINDVGGVQLDSSRRADLEREALDLAMQDAQAQAEQIANGFGVRIAGVKDVRLSGGHAPQREMMRASMAQDSGDSFSPGEMQIRRNIQASFEIGGQ